MRKSLVFLHFSLKRVSAAVKVFSEIRLIISCSLQNARLINHSRQNTWGFQWVFNLIWKMSGKKNSFLNYQFSYRLLLRKVFSYATCLQEGVIFRRDLEQMPFFFMKDDRFLPSFLYKGMKMSIVFFAVVT